MIGTNTPPAQTSQGCQQVALMDNINIGALSTKTDHLIPRSSVQPLAQATLSHPSRESRKGPDYVRTSPSNAAKRVWALRPVFFFSRPVPVEVRPPSVTDGANR